MYNIYTLNLFFNLRSSSVSHPKNWAMHIFLIIDKIDAFFVFIVAFYSAVSFPVSSIAKTLALFERIWHHKNLYNHENLNEHPEIRAIRPKCHAFYF